MNIFFTKQNYTGLQWPIQHGAVLLFQFFHYVSPALIAKPCFVPEDDRTKETFADTAFYFSLYLCFL